MGFGTSRARKAALRIDLLFGPLSSPSSWNDQGICASSRYAPGVRELYRMGSFYPRRFATRRSPERASAPAGVVKPARSATRLARSTVSSSSSERAPGGSCLGARRRATKLSAPSYGWRARMILFRSRWAVIVVLLAPRGPRPPPSAAAKITRQTSRRRVLPFAPVEGSCGGGFVGVRRRCRRGSGDCM
jgi:hypothetical protein